ncbi:hypothetical protein EJ05DRAFT_375946 [Pseudovirgaria hyperparasitica]|uniref:BTB domain-containing protein n=1 Tax=Pseudovirgaria hyperparasitica TaxID=470096 RepID=A0A6A6WAB8_9PEZI|nr:uncharacterized protein EJ05DRAFT_375946 [Pseudovirgaria hyperparasitica]KAF2758061.1 hypothetical protein EJ05DRAFT_375946 [Pseudovirgaria hyperparasitica]
MTNPMLSVVMEDVSAGVLEVIVGTPESRHEVFHVGKYLLQIHSGYFEGLLKDYKGDTLLCRVDPAYFRFFIQYCLTKSNKTLSDHVMNEEAHYLSCVKSYITALYLQADGYQAYLKNALFSGLDQVELSARMICELLFVAYTLSIEDKVRQRIHCYAFRRVDRLRSDPAWQQLKRYRPGAIIGILYSLSRKKFTVKDPMLRGVKQKEDRLELPGTVVCNALRVARAPDTKEHVRQRTHFYAYKHVKRLRMDPAWKELARDCPEVIIAILYSLSPYAARFNGNPVGKTVLI